MLANIKKVNNINSALASLPSPTKKTNKIKADFLYTLDLQWKNSFEIIFYPATLGLGSAFTSIADTTIASFHVQGIDGIEFPEIEYTETNGIKHATGISYPEIVTLRLIEGELGIVRNWAQNWVNNIYTPSLPTRRVQSGKKKNQLAGFKEKKGDSVSINKDVNTEGKNYYYVFNNNQKDSKKNAIIILKSGTGLPNAGGWIMLEGLKIKHIGGFEEISQSSEEPLILSIKMSVDLVKMITPVGLIKNLF